MDSFIKPESRILYFKLVDTLKDRVLKVFAVTASGICFTRAMAAVVFELFILRFFIEGSQVHSLTAPGKYWQTNAVALQQKQQEVI